jgi:NADPH2:quinone reductase
MEGLNQGDGITGIAHAVGSKVTEFQPGGGYKEYALTPSHMTFHIPSTTLFEKAATVPLTAMTAAALLIQCWGCRSRWTNRRGRYRR